MSTPLQANGFIPDPTGPPNQYACVNYNDAVQYTDTGQLAWFKQRINFAYGTDAKVHLDTDGTTIVWFNGAYRLPIQSWLISGQWALDEWTLKNTNVRPLGDWPATP